MTHTDIEKRVTIYITSIKESPNFPADIGYTKSEEAAKEYCERAQVAIDAAWPYIVDAQRVDRMSYWSLQKKPMFKYRRLEHGGIDAIMKEEA